MGGKPEIGEGVLMRWIKQSGVGELGEPLQRGMQLVYCPTEEPSATCTEQGVATEHVLMTCVINQDIGQVVRGMPRDLLHPDNDLVASCKGKLIVFLLEKGDARV